MRTVFKKTSIALRNCYSTNIRAIRYLSSEIKLYAYLNIITSVSEGNELYFSHNNIDN